MVIMTAKVPKRRILLVVLLLLAAAVLFLGLFPNGLQAWISLLLPQIF